MAERKSISAVHVFWKEQEGTPSGWYIETRNAYSEAVGDSASIQTGMDLPQNIIRSMTPRNCAPIYNSGSLRPASSCICRYGMHAMDPPLGAVVHADGDDGVGDERAIAAVCIE